MDGAASLPQTSLSVRLRWTPLACNPCVTPTQPLHVSPPQDFLEKISRGGGAGVTRPQGYRERLDKACTEQCYEAQTLYARLCGGGISGGSGGVSEEAPPLAAGDLTASE